MSYNLRVPTPILLISLAVAGCGKSPHANAVENAENPPVAIAPQPQTKPQSSNPAPSTIRSSNAVDPKSAKSALAVIVGYASLLEQGHIADTRRLWTEGSDASVVEAQLGEFERIKVEIGDPGQMEGAAGSSYIDVPLQLTGRTKSGEAVALAGTATLRRVNDVPGSTELQRRWHIYRVVLQPRP
jgi:hypothetical protein